MGSAIGSLFGGGAPSQPNTSVYQPSGTGSQDQNIQNLLGQQYNTLYGANNPYTQTQPQAQSIFNSLYNNPGTAGYQAGATAAGNAYTGVGQNALMNSSSLAGSVNPLLQGAGQVLNTAFDPQSLLYNQSLQQATNLANVSNAQYGLTGQQAAGNTSNDLNQFNIDWQSQQLQNQLAGLSGASSATGAAGQAGINAGNIGQGGAVSLLAGGATPYETNTAIGSAQQNALNNYIQQLLGPAASTTGTVNQGQSYLNEGVTASNDQATQASQAYQNQLAGAEGIGSLLGGIGNFLFAPTNSFGGASNASSGLSWLSSLFGSSGGASTAADAGSTVLDAAALA